MLVMDSRLASKPWNVANSSQRVVSCDQRARGHVTMGLPEMIGSRFKVQRL
jgi:hypothetical protein